MARRKVWSYFPDRLYFSDAYLDLSHTAALALHRAYVACDRFGRFPASRYLVAGVFRMSPKEAATALDELVAAGLALLFTSVEGVSCAQLVDYDRDAPRDVIRKRKTTDFDHPDDGDRPEARRPASGIVPGNSREVTGKTPGNDREGVGQPPADEPVEARDNGGTRAPKETGDRRQDPPKYDPRPSSEPSRARGETGDGTRKPRQPQPPKKKPLLPGVDPNLERPACDWLERALQVRQRNGFPLETLGNLDDLFGGRLRIIQVKPGFAECVAQQIAMPDDKWGKSLRGAIAYLDRMVHDWIPPSPAPSQRQRHLVTDSMTAAEYAEQTGHDPRQAPLLDTPEAREVMEACGAGA